MVWFEVAEHKHKAKKKNHKCFVIKTEENYYYFLVYKGDTAYNSLWDGLKYSTFEKCAAACEFFVDNKGKKKTKFLYK